MNNDLPINLEECAREPIHIPGAIQPHGLLFVLSEPGLRILQVSENVERYLGILLDQLLGQELSSFLNPEQVEKVRVGLKSVDPREHNPIELQLKTRIDHNLLDGFVHRHDELSYLEVEPGSLENGPSFLNFYKTVSKLTSRLQGASSLTDLFNEAADGIREMTGFDRVIVYRFADNHDGEVVSESKAQGVDSFLGLWYPASDIPAQARQLYVLNPIRNIVDVGYTPVPIVPAINPETHRPADLSFAGLRSVSPVHCEYLTNMGVTASMSISILRQDRLWGLVACHHLQPRFVAYEMRKACTFIGAVLSGEIGRRELEEEAAYRTRATGIQAKFLELMAASPQPMLGLINSSPNLLDLIPADGAAVVKGDRVNMLGNTPSYEDVLTIVGLLLNVGVPHSFVTRSLKNHFPLSESMRAAASGIIALEIARVPATYVLFFRPEVSETVRWGGNPEKPVTVSEDGYRLSPRKSFEIWKEQVSGRSLPWSPGEIRVAKEFRNLISVVAYTK